FLADGARNSVTLASQRVDQWQVDVTLDNRTEAAPRQMEIELDLTFHLTSPDGNTQRNVRQQLAESGTGFDLVMQEQQVEPIWMGFDGNTFLAVVENSGELTLAVCPPGAANATVVNLGTLKQFGVYALEPTFATKTGSLPTNDLVICVPAAGGNNRATTLLRWRIDRKTGGNLNARLLSPDTSLPTDVIGDSTQMRLIGQVDDLSDTASSRVNLFTQTLSNHWELSGRLVSRLTGTSDLGNSFSVDLMLEANAPDAGPDQKFMTTVATVDQVSEPANVDLLPLAAGWDGDRLLLLYESSYQEIHLFIWDPRAIDPLHTHRDVLLSTLQDLHADQFDSGLARLSGSLHGDGLSVTFGVRRELQPMSIPVRMLVKKIPATGDFSVERLGP
ncbi:MAG TPA: hypothetical protein VMD30_01165, partial [Tepidisphaeraceae bacterium]|nr:hypothetical protein [Tepidisphaeraceae bacterium]